MTVAPWVAELASTFWTEVGWAETFPRNLRRPLARAVPLAIVLVPGLRLDRLRDWLRAVGVVCPHDEADRPLRACLAARAEYGLIFLDGTDAPDEQRFSLAHELAHFLRHYRQPRRRACRHLGAQVAEVLDGRRPPTPRERVHALLKDVPLGLHLHLMRRGPRRQVTDAGVAAAEEEADLLAYELLAPADAVRARVGAVRGEAGRERIVEALRTTFGLPADQAASYGRLLLPPVGQDPLLLRLRP